ncbi:MAG TPA: hypothetical protein DCG28_01570 [Lachnospiraceae bacterium]|nr:hypothetical protein [Lachnospiraceae bacterium]
MRFIFGPTGSGKSTLCINEISERDKKLLPSFLITPEQFSYSTQRKLLEKRDGGAVLHTYVHSFTSLAYDIIEKVGASGRKRLDDIGKLMLIRKISFDNKKKLSFYSSVVEKQGFSEKLSGVFTELMHYRITKEAFLEAANNSTSSITKAKAKDIALLYSEYYDILHKNYISADDVLDILAELIAEADVFKNAKIYIDGFISFTPQEINVISKLMDKTADITVTFNINENRREYKKTNFLDPYSDVKTSITKLYKAACEKGFTFEENVFLKVDHRHEKNSGLAFLTRNYLSYKSDTSKTEDIKITYAADPCEELNDVCIKIKKAVIDDGFSYGDISLIVPDDEYNDIAASLFEKYDIPYFSDKRRNLGSHLYCIFVLYCFKIISDGWQSEDVMEIIKTGLTSVAPDDGFRLEKFLKATGLSGEDFWTKTGIKDERDPEKGDYLDSLRLKLYKDIEPLYTLFKEGKQSVIKTAEVFYGICDDLKIDERLNLTAELYEKNGDYYSSELIKQAQRCVINIYEKIYEIMGEEPLNKKEMYRMLKTGINSSSAGLIPPHGDCVNIGDIRRTRLSEIKAVFVTGMNEGKIPPLVSDEGIITDSDRAELVSGGIELGSDNNTLAVQNNYSVYRILCSSAKRLYLSCSTGGMRNEKALPSNALYRIQTLFPDAPIEKCANIIKDVKDIVSVNQLYDDVIKAKHEGMENALYNACIESTEKIEEFGSELEKRLKGISLSGDISKANTDILFPNNAQTSISRLEEYARCPFSYLSKYILHLKQEETYKLSNADSGSLMHYVLENVSNEVKKSYNNIWESLPTDEIPSLVEAATESVKERLNKPVLFATKRYKEYLDRIKSTLVCDIYAIKLQNTVGKFKPVSYELSFGGKNEDVAPLSLKTEFGNYSLIGKIDRLDAFYDENGEKVYLKITDYKSSNREFSTTKLYYGTQLQMMLYMKALLEGGGRLDAFKNKALVPGCIMYFNLSRRSFEDKIPDGENVLSGYGQNGLLSANEDVIFALDEETQRTKKGDIKLSTNRAVRSSVKIKEEDFRSMLDFSEKKAKEIITEMKKGKFSLKPYKDEKTTACEPSAYGSAYNCPFSAICKKECIPGNDIYNIYQEINIKNNEDNPFND